MQYNTTRRYSPLRGISSSSCSGLWPLAKAFSFPLDKKEYLVVQGRQRIPTSPRLAKGTKKSKVGKGYLKVPGWQRVVKRPMLAKGA